MLVAPMDLMVGSLLTLITLAGSAPPALERHAAAEAIASGTEAATRAEVALLEAGRRGVWAVDAALETAEPEAKARLLDAAGRLAPADPEGVTWMLRRGLRDADPRVRLGAVQGLRHSELPARRALLLSRLDEPEASVRVALSEALAELADIEPALRSRLQDPSPRTRATTLAALLRCVDAPARPDLLLAGLKDEASLVRRSVMPFVGAYADARVVRTLGQMVAEAPEDAEAAMSALENAPGGDLELLGLATTAPADLAARSVPHLRAARADLAGLLLPRLPQLEPARAKPLRQAVVDAPTDADLASLLGALTHPEPKRQRAARAWLHAIGAPAYQSAATRLVGAEKEERRPLQALLNERPSREVPPRLVARARTGPIGQRVSAIQTLAVLAGPETLSQLAPLFEDPDPSIRVAAAEAFGDSPLSREALLSMAGAEHPAERAAAVRALGTASDPAARQACSHALDDASEGVRLAAIRALARADDAATIHRLRERARSGSPAERKEAIAVIASSRAATAPEALISLVTDIDPEVRRLVMQHLDG